MTGDERVALILSDIQSELAVYERAPRMFGSHEAQELRVLDLVALRWRITRPDDCLGATRDAYERFIREVNGEPNCGMLWAILRDEGMLSELPRLLGDFARWCAREWPPTA